MKNFKVQVSKGLERYDFIRKAESEAILKEELHKEGFGILTIQVMGDISVEGNKFYFEIVQNGNLKTGTIVSQDIFKAYLKIKYEMKYDLKYIYQNNNSSLEEKQKIIYTLEEQYKIYLESSKKEIEKKQSQEKIKTKVVVEEKVDNFQMKKEIDQVNNVIAKILVKLKDLLELQDEKYLSLEKKEKLKELFNVLIKIKSSTNIPKLKEIGELALTKIGEIELQILENKKDIESKRLLSETNKLLKEVGSKTNFVTKDRDIGYILSNFFNAIIDNFKSTKEKKEKFSIDKQSTSYLKTKLLIEKYEKKLEELNKNIMKNFIIYLIPSEKNNELKINFYLRKKVINQNLSILNSRLTGKTFSYTKIKKGYYSFIEKFLGFIFFFKTPLLYLVFIYSFLFLLLNSLSYFGIYNLNINFYGLFYFLFINIIFILFQYIRGILSLIFTSTIVIFLFILGIINF